MDVSHLAHAEREMKHFVNLRRSPAKLQAR
jgi:hypothetical protein